MIHSILYRGGRAGDEQHMTTKHCISWGELSEQVSPSGVGKRTLEGDSVSLVMVASLQTRTRPSTVIRTSSSFRSCRARGSLKRRGITPVRTGERVPLSS